MPRLLVPLRHKPHQRTAEGTRAIKVFIRISTMKFRNQVSRIDGGKIILKSGVSQIAAEMFRTAVKADFLSPKLQAREIFRWGTMLGNHMFAAEVRNRGITSAQAPESVHKRVIRETGSLIIDAWFNAGLITEQTKRELKKLD
jgi:hypothetical protein